MKKKILIYDDEEWSAEKLREGLDCVLCEVKITNG